VFPKYERAFIKKIALLDPVNRNADGVSRTRAASSGTLIGFLVKQGLAGAARSDQISRTGPGDAERQAASMEFLDE
jgi:hypothetical protein